MYKFFDYIFYRVCKAYSSTKSSSPEFGAVCITSATQAFNIISFLMIIEVVNQKKNILNTAINVGIIVFFLVLNYIRYIYRDSNNYASMKERWSNENKEFPKGVFVIIFISFYSGFSFWIGNLPRK